MNEIPKYTVIQYIRKKRIPIGVMTAVKSGDSFKIGYSLCNKKDRFNKAMALKIALGRAEMSGAFSTCIGLMGESTHVPHSVNRMIPAFVDRCKKYYRV